MLEEEKASTVTFGRPPVRKRPPLDLSLRSPLRTDSSINEHAVYALSQTLSEAAVRE